MRIKARHKQRIQIAGFPELKYLQEPVREELSKDAQTALPEIETQESIKEGGNIVFCGNPAIGKTHMSVGLGVKACLEGYTVFLLLFLGCLHKSGSAALKKVLSSLKYAFKHRILLYRSILCCYFSYLHMLLRL